MITKFKEFINTIDILNTLHGGVSEPLLSLTELADGREIRVRIPGVDREALKVEIVNHKLSVFYLIPVLTNGQLMQMPQVVYNKMIPYFIDANGIAATYDDHELIVHLPFNELSSGYTRKLEIN